MSTWIVDNLFDDLALPDPPASSADERHFEDQRGRRWSTRLLNWVLQQVLEQETDGTHLAAIGAIEHLISSRVPRELYAKALTAELHER